MKNPQVGNVVRRNGSVEKIVGDLVYTRDIDDEYGACFHIKPSTQITVCWNCYEDNVDEGESRHDRDCKFCKGKGEYVKKIPGISSVKLLGETVNEYKLSELIKQKAKIEKEIIKIQKRVSASATTRKPRNRNNVSGN